MVAGTRPPGGTGAAMPIASTRRSTPLPCRTARNRPHGVRGRRRAGTPERAPWPTPRYGSLGRGGRSDPRASLTDRGDRRFGTCPTRVKSPTVRACWWRIGRQVPNRSRLQVLGGFAARVDGRELGRADWGRLSAERLVKLLAVTPGHRLTREVAAETLWPGMPPSPAAPTCAKPSTSPVGRWGPTACSSGAATIVALDPRRLHLDLDVLQAAMARITSGEAVERGAPGCAAALDTVLELGGRDLLPDDLYEDWLVGPRERIRDVWVRMALRGSRGRARSRAGAPTRWRSLTVCWRRIPADEAATDWPSSCLRPTGGTTRHAGSSSCAAASSGRRWSGPGPETSRRSGLRA